MKIIDRFGRHIHNLRISVTDRCNFRCVYCMPPEGVPWFPRETILTYEEMARVARIATTLGVFKFRITGGEPLVRKDLPAFVRMLTELEGVRDLGLTTNGYLLKEQAQALYDAGLRRLNVSLDSLDRATFAELTRRDLLPRVWEGLEEAERVGFAPIKVNAVALRGYTDREILAFAELARRKPYEVRFIEFMPLDAEGNWAWDKTIPGQEIVDRIHAVWPLEPVPNGQNPAPATVYRFRDGAGRIGIIPSVTQPFCESCGRIRLTADGKLRTCLFAHAETDLRGPLRSGASDEEIAALILQAARNKEPGHGLQDGTFVRPNRSMSQIGG